MEIVRSVLIGSALSDPDLGGQLDRAALGDPAPQREHRSRLYDVAVPATERSPARSLEEPTAVLGEHLTGRASALVAGAEHADVLDETAARGLDWIAPLAERSSVAPGEERAEQEQLQDRGQQARASQRGDRGACCGSGELADELGGDGVFFVELLVEEERVVG